MAKVPEYRNKLARMHAQMGNPARRARALKVRSAELERRVRKERETNPFHAPRATVRHCMACRAFERLFADHPPDHTPPHPTPTFEGACFRLPDVSDYLPRDPLPPISSGLGPAFRGKQCTPLTTPPTHTFGW